MLFDSFLSLVWDGSILCRFVEAYSVTQHFIAIDLHSGNAVICVRRNALNKAGELVGKSIWCGRVSIRDGLDNFIKVLVLGFCAHRNHVLR